MNFGETKQKQLLREAAEDFLALLVIDFETGAYDILYTDNGYRDFGNRRHGQDFFHAWKTVGLSLVWEADRARMEREISPEYLGDQLETRPYFLTACRFAAGNEPRWCRIRVARDSAEPARYVLSIRDIDREMQIETQHQEEIRRILEQNRRKNFMSQMHPHFLYNALSSIREIVLTDPEYAADLLCDFTIHLRAGIRAMSSADRIPLSKEIENTKSYLNIEKMRLGSRLQVELDLRAPDFPVIPFCIQPLAENAVRHGISEKGSAGGTVRIRTRELSGGWEIAVEDDGVGFDPDAVRRETESGERDSTGLTNLTFRLEQLMGASLEFRSAPGEGCTALIRIPRTALVAC